MPLILFFDNLKGRFGALVIRNDSFRYEITKNLG